MTTAFHDEPDEITKATSDLSKVMEIEIRDPVSMIRNCSAAAVCALLAGSVIDNSIRKMQGVNQKGNETNATSTPSRENAAFFFAVQLFMNIGFLLVKSVVSKRFIPWLQLTSSGLMFSVLVFAVQERFLDNTLLLTRF